jgi:threonine dehydrogenase-like Zn-dependent dehydrogenase
VNPKKEDYNRVINELTDDEGVDVACDCVGGTGIGVKQSLDQVRHNGTLVLYGDNYAKYPDFSFNRFHEDGLQIRNLNAMHYNELSSIMNCYEAYRAQVRGVFDEVWPIVWENSSTHTLNEIANVFSDESKSLDQQASIKTVIKP